MDAGIEAGATDARVPCAAEEECDDALFCNGVEQCIEGSCARAETRPCAHLACDEATETCETDCEVNDDADGDGVAAIGCGGEDCNDTDPTIYPGSMEVPADGVDQDCDGADVCFADRDGDGFASSELVVSEDLDCDDPGELGLEAPGGDCADDDATIHPDAIEVVADGVDQNCDLLELCHVDLDGDGFRREGDATVGSEDLDCEDDGEADALAPEGDCDDDDPLRNPFQPELPGDGIDSNCDDQELCYVDVDGDGWRSMDTSLTVTSDDPDCDDPGEAAITTPGADCRDDDPEIYPRRFEVCNGIDDNCDGRIDERYRFGGGPSLLMQRRCGTTDVGRCEYGTETCVGGTWGSCSGAISAGATEFCDGQDWDCDGTADEGCGCTAGETRSCGSAVGACTLGTQTCGLSGQWGACIGGVTSTDESCNGLDDDCDGETDEPGADGCDYYGVDADGDGHTDSQPYACLCGPTGDHTRLRTSCSSTMCPPVLPDCDDGDASVHPGAREQCDSIDHDCDGSTTEPDAIGCTRYWTDVDNDTYGTGSSQCLCAPSAGYRATRNGDCCDIDPRARPGSNSWRSSPNACRCPHGPIVCASMGRTGDGWDYNCDGDPERRWEAGAGCHGTCTEEDYGWIGPWPGCGSDGAWLDFCLIAPVPPFCLFVPELRTQMCR